MYSLYGHLRDFKLKQKYQQHEPLFPDYASLSYHMIE